MSKYAILRTAKIKDNSKITACAEHNLRTRLQENIDPEKSKDNIILVNSLGASSIDPTDLQKKLNKFFDNLGIKPRNDSVKMMEFVCTASPKFYEGKSKKDIKHWADEQVKFFQKEYGDQLKHGVLHLDETTPHIHFLISNEVESVKKYRNQLGEFHKKTWSISAKRFDPVYLKDLQTRYAKHNEQFGLIRGIKDSKNTNQSLKKFYKAIHRAMSKDYGAVIEKVIDSMEGDFMFKRVSKDEIREKLKPTINYILKTQSALKEKLKIDYQAIAIKLIDDEKKLRLDKAEFEKHKSKSLVLIQRLKSEITDLMIKSREKDDEIKELKEELTEFRKRDHQEKAQKLLKMTSLPENHPNFMPNKPKPKKY